MSLQSLVFAPAPGPEDPYEAVEGVDAATVALKRQFEAQVEHKVASDYVHIVVAYGVIWALFVIYGLFLWWKGRTLARDLEELSRRVGAAGQDPP
jgi:hypothetical protein